MKREKLQQQAFVLMNELEGTPKERIDMIYMMTGHTFYITDCDREGNYIVELDK